MRNVLFTCDIDNTLIYSKRYPHDGWLCVEWIHDDEQAYISPATMLMLSEVMKRTILVGVTSRSVEQYLRLRLPEKLSIALTANGADLLLDDMPDPLWRQETDRLLAPWQEELKRCYQILALKDSYIRCRIVDEAYLFVYCNTNIDPPSDAAALQARTDLSVIVDGKKIYLLPPPLNKGASVVRLMQRLNIQHCIAAGDSTMDLPMLYFADQAIAPKELSSRLPKGTWVCPKGRLFSEFVMETILSMCNTDTM